MQGSFNDLAFEIPVDESNLIMKGYVKKDKSSKIFTFL